MRRARWWGYPIAGLLGLLLALGAGVRPAGATNVFNGATITADGLTFTVSGCTDTVASVAGSCTNGGNAIAEFVLGTGVRGADFSIESKSGGALFSGLAGGKTDELVFTLQVSATPTDPVNAASLSMVTSGTAGASTVLASEGAFPAGFSPSTLSLTAAGTVNGADATKLTTTFDLNYDIKLVQANGQSLVLSSITSIFNPAPEPLSMSVFGVGLIGLGVVRRVRRRSRQTA